MKRIARLFGFVIICLISLAVALIAQPVLFFASTRRRLRFMALVGRTWARALLRMMGIKVVADGLLPEHDLNHYLLVSNHQSYLDIIIIASIFPTSFVAMQEVRDWPLLGWLARLGGTVFVNREDTHSSVRCAYRASRLLRDQITMQVFPESKTNDGTRIQPFKALFFASALRAQAPILPLTLNTRAINGQTVDELNRDRVCWYGDMEFMPHFWDFLTVDSAEFSVVIHESIRPLRMQGARSIAQAAEQKVISGFDPNRVSVAPVVCTAAPAQSTTSNVKY